MRKDKCFNCKETKYLIYNTLLADTSCEWCGKWASEEEQEFKITLNHIALLSFISAILGLFMYVCEIYG